MTDAPAEGGRVFAVDWLRGLVMLVLVTDPSGGFGFHRIATALPDDPTWSALAAQFTHATWVGCHVWDLVMPLFVCLVGVALAHSLVARAERGESTAWAVWHVALRSATLVVLGTVLLVPVETQLDQILPLLLLVPGLPLARWLERAAGVAPRAAAIGVRVGWTLLLVAAVVRLRMRADALGDYDLVHLLQQLGFAYPFAWLICRAFDQRGRLVAAGVILVVWWAAFALYPLPPPSLDPASVGAVREIGWFPGFFAHWNMGTNFAAAVDQWLLNELPRAVPYGFNAHGYQTLNFVPLVASIVLGAVVGTMLGRAPGLRERLRAATFALGMLAVGAIAAVTVTPLVKSIWTSSWTLVSAGVSTLVLCGAELLFGDAAHSTAAEAVAAVGRNPIVLYVLAIGYRWRLLLPGEWVLGADAYAGVFGPLVQSGVVVAVLWGLALLLARRRLYVRL